LTLIVFCEKSVMPVSVVSATRRMMSELNSLLDRKVFVKLKDGTVIRGEFFGFDDKTFNIMLKKASDGQSEYPLMIIMADSIAYLSAAEAPLFNPDEFAQLIVGKLNLREADVKVYPEAGIVVVLNSIKVSEKGVEGSGPLAHKIYGLFTEYMESKRKS